MSPIRMARDIKDLYRGFVDLLVVEEPNEDASYEIAASAERFSRNTQEVVDDKLNFSATLMRAGEVEAANRLLKEFHDEVLEEEVALIERVNEVKAAEAVRKAGMTRVRLARVLAVALVGSTLLSVSAAGMALAGFMKDRAAQLSEAQVAIRGGAEDRVLGTRLAARAQRDGSLRHVRIGRVKLLLSASELRTIRELTGGSVDESGLADIIGLLPEHLAQKVQDAIVVATDAAEQVAEAVAEQELADLKAERRKARRAKQQAQQEPTPPPSETEETKEDEEEDSGLGPQPSDEESNEGSDDADEGDGDPDEDEGRSTDDDDPDVPPILGSN